MASGRNGGGRSVDTRSPDALVNGERTGTGLVLAHQTELSSRIVGVISAWIDVTAAQGSFVRSCVASAADPDSPLSPFSSASAPTRKAAVRLWQQTIEGSDASVTAELVPDIARLLWLYFLGVVAFWVHDTSQDSARTRAVVERTGPLMAQAVQLTRIPAIASLLADLVALVSGDERAE